MYQVTTAIKKIAALKNRLRCIQGGTSASKSVSIILYLVSMAQSDKSPTLTSVISESFPHLKRGVIRDFLQIMTEHKYFRDDLWNKTDFTYTFETGSKIEFFSADQPGKVRGPRRDRLFINEANNISYETFDQLEVRTKDFIFLDWNPVAEYWFYTDILNKRSDYDHITLTYKDNEALDPQIVASIEQRKGNKNWFRVYGEGQLGEIEAKIYKDWIIIDDIPHEARLERYGLDFGYTNDPSAIIAVYRYNGGYILDEITYQKGLSNKQIFDIFFNQPPALIIADSAEPKSIDEIRSYGSNILGAEKGRDSIAHGIQIVQDQRISMTKRSLNLIKEYRNYLWQEDKQGRRINEPSPIFNHCFAGESLVHTIYGRVRIDSLVGKEGYLFSKNGEIQRFSNVRETRKNAEVVSLLFDDGDTLTVTPDHLLLLPNNQWIEAGLLNHKDLIQSGIYDSNCIKNKAGVSWYYMDKVSRREILQGLLESKARVFAQGRLETFQWENRKEFSYSSQGSRSEQQPDRELRAETQVRTSVGTHDSREEREIKKMGRKNQTSYKEVAWIRRGDCVAQVTWEEGVEEPKDYFEDLRSLSQGIHDKNQSSSKQILSSKLQNESKTKKVVRITRGFRRKTYNLEVENTHCLVVNGVVAHNCMDALRYAICSLHKDPEPTLEDELRILTNRENTISSTRNDFGV